MKNGMSNHMFALILIWIARYKLQNIDVVRARRAKFRAMGLTSAGTVRKRTWTRLDKLSPSERRERKLRQQREAMAKARKLARQSARMPDKPPLAGRGRGHSREVVAGL